MISQDTTKTASYRSSTMILDFLGDIGGFKEALMLLLFLFGEYFSSLLFVPQVGKELYKGKKKSVN